ncbi:hypothetical protein AKJ16_DCAP07348 [Drosera capensis]
MPSLYASKVYFQSIDAGPKVLDRLGPKERKVKTRGHLFFNCVFSKELYELVKASSLFPLMT